MWQYIAIEIGWCHLYDNIKVEIYTNVLVGVNFTFLLVFV